MNGQGYEMSKREGILLGVVCLAILIFVVPRFGTEPEEGPGPAAIKRSLRSSVEKVRALEQSTKKMQERVGVVEFTLPTADQAAEVRSYIDRVARESGLGFPALTASDLRKGKGFQWIGYKFKATTKMAGLVKFVDKIQAGEYLFTLESWDLEADKDPSNVVADLSLKAYFRAATKGGKT